MAPTTESITSGQLKQARTHLWHQDGTPLRTQDDARTWLDEAGLVPYYPHTQFAAPQCSFAEAILGRPEIGWVPAPPSTASAQEPYAADGDVEDPESVAGAEADQTDFDEDDEDLNEPEDDDEDLDEDEDDDEDLEGGAEDEEGVTPEASDAEVMLSDDDEFNEDGGDEIAEEDRIHAGGNPLPNDLREAEAPRPEPINGFSTQERETVRHTLARMVAEGSAVPLNLLGSPSSEPDFICSAQAFSFVYTLRGDKGWKQEPAQTGSMRLSPLAAKVHESMKANGAMTPGALAQELGHGVVESAVIRALSELWAILRVIPLGAVDHEPSRWELLTAHHMRQLKAGANAGQPTALSALLSLYLAQVLAASADDIEVFLSPLAARSRIREVVSALSASRQLDQIVVEGKTLFYIPAALDNLPVSVPDQAATTAAMPRSRYEDDDRRAMIEAQRARDAAAGPSEERRPYTAARQVERSARDGRPVGGPRKSFGDRPGGGFTPQRRTGNFGGPRREGGYAPRSDDRERRPFQRPDDAPAPPRNEFARPWDQESGATTPRPSAEGGRAPFPPRDGERRPSAYGRPAGDRKPYAPREGGDRPYAPRGGDRPYGGSSGGDRRPYASGRPAEDRPRGDRRPFTPREGGDRRPFTPRENSGERRPFTPREGGDRRPFTPRSDRPFTPRSDRPFTPRTDRPFTPKSDRPFTPRADRPSPPREDRGDRPFRPREEGERRPFTPRGDRPYSPREGGDRKPFAPRGDRPFAPRGDRPFTPRGDRPFTPREDGDRRPFTPREGGGGRPFTPRGDRPFTPREGGARPFTPREGGGDRRPFTPRGDRPYTPRPSGDRGSYSPRKSFGADRGGAGEGRPDRNRFAGEPGERRPSFQSGASSAGPGGARFGGAGFGRDRKGSPGSYGKPGFSPARRGPGSGPGRGGAPRRRPE